ncbi:hypothetical protein AMECASPLE_030848 [Ameca splendens]|uniref:Uncharacterized protein n=1 Tax=Ameca splendens TaxID=208324 RepID=A0ABV0Z5P7_9TELE
MDRTFGDSKLALAPPGYGPGWNRSPPSSRKEPPAYHQGHQTFQHALLLEPMLDAIPFLHLGQHGSTAQPELPPAPSPSSASPAAASSSAWRRRCRCQASLGGLLCRPVFMVFPELQPL